MFAAAIGALTAVARTGASEHDDVQRHFNFLRELVQKVVIAPSADGKSAELTIHGRLPVYWLQCRRSTITRPVCVNSTQASSPAVLGRVSLRTGQRRWRTLTGSRPSSRRRRLHGVGYKFHWLRGPDYTETCIIPLQQCPKRILSKLVRDACSPAS